jgi:DNA ligase-1
MKPMLAHRYQEHGHKLPEVFHVQPKLNGVRALCQEGKFQSRDEIMWYEDKLMHLSAHMSAMPPRIVFDGELYLHGCSLQRINSAIAVKSRLTNELTAQIEYWVYDMYDFQNPTMPFEERILHLTHLLSPIGSPIIVCPTFRVNRQRAEHFFAKAKEQKFEGIMYRVSESPYGTVQICTNKENRWPCLLKRKDFLDAIVEVVGIESGTGKYSEAMGALVCEYANGKRFNVGSGFSDAERFRHIVAPPIGERIRINYEMLSDDGTPLKATFESFEE